jgi:hypothetical protein
MTARRLATKSRMQDVLELASIATREGVTVTVERGDVRITVSPEITTARTKPVDQKPEPRL